MDSELPLVHPAFTARLRNLGPIRRADLQLSPLTVLVGPNNSGKSVAATVLHVITNSSPPSLERSRRTVPRRRFGYHLALEEDGIDADDVTALIASMVEPAEPHHLELSKSQRATFEKAVTSVFTFYGRQLVAQLEIALGGGLDDIIRTQDGRRMPARLEIESQTCGWRIAIRFARPQPRLDVLQHPDPARVMELIQASDLRYIRPWGPHLPRELFYAEFVGLLGSALFSGFPQASHYLPAARSGILQSHRTLAAALVRSSTRAGIEEMSVPKVSGLVADFISEVLEMTPRRRRTDFSDIADFLETGILRGEVAVELKSAYPEISYRTSDLNIPLHRTSSMVSELAPVVLYLRYVLDNGDLLLIEEPESHLHPESQLRVARAIARLSGRGLWVALTTHSDYLLQSISNAVRATSTGQQEVFVDLAGPSGLPLEMVSAYLFHPSPDGHGTDTSRLQISRELGISDEEFARVTEVLYKETVRLDRLVEAGS